ncbi:DUF6993 domain-containing protein [Leifsonia xyli]|nr:hypothetical protein [Leifsonia xyli]
MTRPIALTRTAIVSASLALGLSVLLAGCAPQPASPAGSVGQAQGATPVPSAAPTLVPGGTAEQNLPFFDHINRATLAANPEAKGRDFIDALVAAGFAKADMQVTVDTTTIGLKANSIQFSVKLGDSCLIGQNGADAGGYNSTVAAPIPPTGACLVGQTRAIDW